MRVEASVPTLAGKAVGFTLDDQQRVKSVSVALPAGSMRDLDCTLLVDASGPSRASLKWLEKAGFAAPATEQYDPADRYVCWDVFITDRMGERIDKEAGYDKAVKEIVYPGGYFRRDEVRHCDVAAS